MSHEAPNDISTHVMQIISSSIWTHQFESISCGDKQYANYAPFEQYLYNKFIDIFRFNF